MTLNLVYECTFYFIVTCSAEQFQCQSGDCISKALVNNGKENTTFDPSTLYAVNTVRDRVRRRKSQVLVAIDPEEAEELPGPESKIDSINEGGAVKILFS